MLFEDKLLTHHIAHQMQDFLLTKKSILCPTGRISWDTLFAQLLHTQYERQRMEMFVVAVKRQV